jgi:hypothetical protein
MNISIPSTVDMIEDAAFQGCHGVEYCLIEEDEILVNIGNESFAECHCLRSFYIPREVETIGANCFKRCVSLHRLKFESSESLQKIVGTVPMAKTLEHVGFPPVLSIFKLEVEHVITDLGFGEFFSTANGSSNRSFIGDT